jgi:hypothetical protein
MYKPSAAENDFSQPSRRSPLRRNVIRLLPYRGQASSAPISEQPTQPLPAASIQTASPQTPLTRPATLHDEPMAQGRRWSGLQVIWREALFPFLMTRLALVVVGVLADLYLTPLRKPIPSLPPLNTDPFPAALWLMWRRFDAGYYVFTAMQGYLGAQTLHTYSNWAFFPLFPMLINPLGHLLGGTQDDFYTAGLIISNAASLVAVIYLYLIVRREFSNRVASRTVLFLGLFPMSFYLTAIYSESLFLACALACFYYTRTRRWWLAGIFGGFASLARAEGILLVIPLAWEYWQVLSDQYAPLPARGNLAQAAYFRLWLHSRARGPLLAARSWRNWLPLLAWTFVPAGLLSFMVYAQLKVGDFFATFHNEQWGWGRHFVPPWQLLATSLMRPQSPDPLNWNFWLLNITMVFLFLGATVWAFRRLPLTYAIYTLLVVLFPLSSSRLNSISRYYLVVFPAYILLALWVEKKGGTYSEALTLLFASVQAILMVFFVLKVPAIA